METGHRSAAQRPLTNITLRLRRQLDWNAGREQFRPQAFSPRPESPGLSGMAAREAFGCKALRSK